jgi:putative transcriptional regulator
VAKTTQSSRKKVVRDRVSSDLAETALDLNRLGLIDQHALARVKTLCLDEPPQFTPARVASIRIHRARMSQSVFAKLLNVSLSTVQKWEAPSAEKHPSGAAAKLLHIIEKKGIEAIV